MRRPQEQDENARALREEITLLWQTDEIRIARPRVGDEVKNVLFYLEERQNRFPGVQVEPIWLRTYPLHDAAAQLFGTIGPITPSDVTCDLARSENPLRARC